MRSYLSLHREKQNSFSPRELDILDCLMQRAIDALGIVDPADRNQLAARILSINSLGGRSSDDILEIVVRLHQQGYTPSGRRSDTRPSKRTRTERQRGPDHQKPSASGIASSLHSK
jgi:hypothetical protein